MALKLINETFQRVPRPVFFTASRACSVHSAQAVSLRAVRQWHGQSVEDEVRLHNHQLKISTRVNTAKLSHGTDDPDSDQVSASLLIFQPSLLPPLLTVIAKAKLPPRLLSYNLTRRITTTSGVLYRKQTVEGT